MKMNLKFTKDKPKENGLYLVRMNKNRFPFMYWFDKSLGNEGALHSLSLPNRKHFLDKQYIEGAEFCCIGTEK